MPPKPSWGKKKSTASMEHVFSVEELRERAGMLRREAESLMGSAPPPSLSIQLGNILLQLDSKAYESMLKKWDQKGRGEFLKAEMRLNLRNAGLTVTSAESDALFDTCASPMASGLERTANALRAHCERAMNAYA